MDSSVKLEGVVCTALYSETSTSKKDGKSYTNHFAVFEWSNYSNDGREFPNGCAVTAAPEKMAGLVKGGEYDITVGLGGYPYDSKDKVTGAPTGRRVFAKNVLFRWAPAGTESAPAQKQKAQPAQYSNPQPAAELEDDLPF